MPDGGLLLFVYVLSDAWVWSPGGCAVSHDCACSRVFLSGLLRVLLTLLSVLLLGSKVCLFLGLYFIVLMRLQIPMRHHSVR